MGPRLEVAAVLHPRARADAVPALLPGRRGVGVPVRKRGAGEPRPALRHRDLVSILAALASAGAGRRHAPGAVRMRALLEPGAADRLLQLRRGDAAHHLGARARLAAGRDAFAADALDAGSRRRGALLPAPVRVHLPRAGGGAGLHRRAPPRAAPRMAAQAALVGTGRRAVRTLAPEQPGGAPRIGRVAAADGGDLGTPGDLAPQPHRRAAGHLAGSGRRVVPARAARRHRAHRLAPAARARRASVAPGGGRRLAGMGGGAVPRVSRLHRMDVAAQRALRSAVRVAGAGAPAAGARAARRIAPLAGGGDGLLRRGHRAGEHPRFRARSGSVRRCARARSTGPAPDRDDLRAELALCEVQRVPPLPGLLPRADGRRGVVLVRRAPAVAAPLPAGECASAAPRRLGVARECVSERSRRLLL